jgi:FixJ family two-component response regulator
MGKKFLYVVDDNRDFADSVDFMLANHGYSVSIYTDTEVALDALKTIDPINPACLLLDVRMPQMSGPEMHDKLLRAGVDLPIIYLTGHGDIALAVETMEKGAFSFLEKPVDFQKLVELLEVAFSASVQCRRQSIKSRLLANERALALKSLTLRETEVLNGILEGYSARRIGELLFISAKTVDFHRNRIMKKLQAKKVAELHRIVALATTEAKGS